MAAGAEQLLKTLARHVHDERVLDAIRTVPRDAFVPPELRDDAWENIPLPIGHDQTISQPYIVGFMTQALGLRGGERVLEVGTGSGYMAALLAHKAQHVITMEIRPELVEFAQANLRRDGSMNVSVRHADGSRGLPEEGPFDAILLSGSVAEVPPSLLAQLKVGGRLAAIVGQLPIMRAMLFTRSSEHDFASVELFDTVAPRLSGFGEPPRFQF